MSERRVFAVEAVVYVKAWSEQDGARLAAGMMRTFQQNHDSVVRTATGAVREVDPDELVENA